MWDATCPDSLAVSYRAQATSGAGHVVALSEERKAVKYSHVTPAYVFTPVAIETSGPHAPASEAFGGWAAGECGGYNGLCLFLLTLCFLFVCLFVFVLHCIVL